MQYKCETCYDTGSRDQIGTYLDCNECDVAQTRRDLNDFVKSLGPTHPEDVALAIHQRALAMAPKQEADHINDVVKMVAPEGWKLVPEDPTGDMFRAAAKIDNEMFAGGSSHGAEDGQVWAAMYDAAPEAPIAAPAVANGVLTDERILRISHDMQHRNAGVWPGDVAYARAILAAAGPDAALVKALEKVLHVSRGTSGRIILESSDEADIRAAISGAKGN